MADAGHMALREVLEQNINQASLIMNAFHYSDFISRNAKRRQLGFLAESPWFEELHEVTSFVMIKSL